MVQTAVQTQETQMNDNLSYFDPLTRDWFRNTLGEPTDAQKEAWPAIASGRHVLVSAPTGTGKTLSAFLVYIDRLLASAREGKLEHKLYLIYVSPLKSLAGDIRENLRRPLDGITKGQGGLNVAIRTGDTSAAERRKMAKSPPHILITTPESLYLLLSSLSGQAMLCTAKYIIIDELHALIDTKRGAHLTLSMARLDRLCEKPLQRIGLSATIDPLTLAADYLAGSGTVIVAPKMKKDFEIAVISPAGDMRVLPEGTIWPEIARAVYVECEGARSVIAFTDGRMYAEKLAYYVNEIAGEGFAKTHHGCVSKEQRAQAEQELRSGKLRLLCATSSMELGIDVGEIDRVVQIGCPKSISSVMQRLGRAGHNPGRVSVMKMFPRMASEGLYCGLTARLATLGGIEKAKPPRLCLDVLAQHLVSMTVGDGYTVDGAMDILSGAYPFRDVKKADVEAVLAMLAGDFEHKRDIPVRPRLLYDRVNGVVEGDAYSRMLAVSTGGTIPDTGMFKVRGENGVKLGELDEEYVFEARVGDKFLLGSFAWRITRMDKDTVTVRQASPEGAQPPFWRNVFMSRDIRTGRAFGAMMRELTDAASPERIMDKLMSWGLDEAAAYNAAGYIARQLEATGVLPDDHTIVVEHFSDEAGDNQLMIHSVFGKEVNAPLSILLQEAAKQGSYMDVSSFEDDDGILLMSAGSFPEGAILTINPETARERIAAILPATPLFHMTFRYNAARALMMGVRKGKRQPLWVQRLRGAEMLDAVIRHDGHPLITETKRECLEDYWDIDGVEYILNALRSGAIKVREVFLNEPSPMSLPLRRQAEATLLYEYNPTTTGIQRAAQDAFKEITSIKPDKDILAGAAARRLVPEDERSLHSLLMMEGDIIAGELDVPLEWFENLSRAGRARYIEPGLWIAAEHENEYAEFELNKEQIIRRSLRYRGTADAGLVAERYFIGEEEAGAVLETLRDNGSAILDSGLYYHADVYERAVRETITARRRQVKTQPPERYAALLASRLRAAAPAEGQLRAALEALAGQSFPADSFEASLLPARCSAYRPALLDTLLGGGEFFWRWAKRDNKPYISFHRQEEADWDADMSIMPDNLDEDERIIYSALQKRGASFTTALTSRLQGRPAHDKLLNMLEKGLITADSFIPVRQALNRDSRDYSQEKASARRRVNARVMTLTAGRWDLSRPVLEPGLDQAITKAFDKYAVLCRETAKTLNLPWDAALERLRVMEYTGAARRGYFVEGFSGAQYIREKDFYAVTGSLDNPDASVVWLNAQDPLQAWGGLLPHLPGMSFALMAGTAVALKAGLPVAILERQGQHLRVLDDNALEEALKALIKGFEARRIFPHLKRLMVKQYPPEAAEFLKAAGFTAVMGDFVLYQAII
ncbi:MAG: DEAD/DEAH box helicase [Clostridiales bacterium]|jgi:ATP-dependent Lhr-like helicase|nr:DEAD/DEAH box helicase [Clostridiales bacterium]